jgi:hypothetical protein
MGSQGEAQLCASERVLLCFKLPTSSMPIEIVGLVR